MTNVDSPLTANLDRPESNLGQQFRAASEKQQLPLVDSLIAAGDAGIAVLVEHLQAYQAQGAPLSPIGLVPAVTAKAYHRLYHTGLATDFLKTTFPQGIVPLRSENNVDYQPLQQLLLQEEWQEADKLHNLKLCEAASEAALQRKWIYFTEVSIVAIADLRTLNALWMAHSENKFGYSVQREIWLGANKNWDKFWPKIQWKDGNTWTRYPGSFTWNLEAPRGHLPLSNQLRGLQVMKALMQHPAWTPDSPA
ncbi:MAG: hypothetical protein RLZZ511_2560 [Cyanobacteriota bacterium]|jgi:hypothetical protein